MQNYRVEIIQYTNNQNRVFSDCNSITFVNTGTSAANVSGYTILSGNFLSIPGNLGEIDRTQYTLKFDNTGTNLLTIIRKSYV